METYPGDQIFHFLREVRMGSFGVEFEVYSCYAAVCICERTRSVTRTSLREREWHTIHTPPILKRREIRNKLKSQDTKGPKFVKP